MIFGRIRSGLFIDYENVPQNAVRDGLAGLIRWLEDGEFDPDERRRRQLVDRRVYWNSSSRHHEPEFKAHDFKIVHCERHAGLKNAADIKLALDIHETVLKPQQRIDEYIIVSSDTDFIPLLQRLNLHNKRSVMVVDQTKPTVYTSFDYHADIIIPQRDLIASANYRRPKRSWFGWLWSSEKQTPSGTSKEDVAKGNATEQSHQVPTVPQRSSGKDRDLISEAEKRVIQAIGPQPNQATAHKKIKRALQKVKGLHTINPKKGQGKVWLGFESYEGLMRELARRSARIVVRDTANGGFDVIYVPHDETD